MIEIFLTGNQDCKMNYFTAYSNSLMILSRERRGRIKNYKNSVSSSFFTEHYYFWKS